MRTFLHDQHARRITSAEMGGMGIFLHDRQEGPIESAEMGGTRTTSAP
jgi:hypothetical protein